MKNNIMKAKLIKCFNGGCFEPEIEAIVKVNKNTGEIFDIPPFPTAAQEDMSYLWQEIVIINEVVYEVFNDNDKYYIELGRYKEENTKINY